MTDSDDKTVEIGARIMITQHRDLAWFEAARQVSNWIESGDPKRGLLWARIMWRIDEMEAEHGRTAH